MTNKTKKKNIFARIGSFFKEVRVEAFKRIIWPTPSQTLNNTIIVLVVCLVVGAIIWLLDFLFTGGLNLIIELLPKYFSK